MVFANIEYLFLLLLLIPYIIWYILYKGKQTPALQVSDTHMYEGAPKSYKIYLLHVPFMLRIIAFVMLVIIFDAFPFLCKYDLHIKNASNVHLLTPSSPTADNTQTLFLRILDF